MRYRHITWSLTVEIVDNVITEIIYEPDITVQDLWAVCGPEWHRWVGKRVLTDEDMEYFIPIVSR